MERVVHGAVSIANEASRVSAYITSQIVEKSNQVGVGYNGSLYESAEEKTQEIPLLLDSKFDKDKIDGLKRLIALISKGHDVSSFFPHVVKNVASTSFEVRKLVYIFLLRYAEEQQELALLSINTFQKDLSDRNPMIRAMALRVMSSIKIPAIVPIITLALRKCVTDLSPYVRKAVANAIPKCHALDLSQLDFLVEILQQLLNDKSTIVLGPAITAFNVVCPSRYDLIHKSFRKFCHLLSDIDEWGQLETIELLHRYLRVHLKSPSSSALELIDLDPDHALFLGSCKSLLYSRNPAVVVAVSLVYFHSAPKVEFHKCVPALMRSLRSRGGELRMILIVLRSMVHLYASPFSSYYRNFIVLDNDSPEIRALKLDILVSIGDATNCRWILNQFKVYACGMNRALALETIRAWSRLVTRLPDITEDSLHTLMQLIESSDHDVVGETVIVIRRILQKLSNHTLSHQKIVSRLVRSYSSISVPMAKASILWLICHYIETMIRSAPDVLRVSAQSFADEEPIVKLSILQLSAILIVYIEREFLRLEDAVSTNSSLSKTDIERVSGIIRKLVLYVLSIAKFDLNYDVRDRCRFFDALVYQPLFGVETVINLDSTEKRSLYLDTIFSVLIASRNGSQTSGLDQQVAGKESLTYMFGSLSHLCQKLVPGYASLPDWAPESTKSSVRDTEETIGSANKDRVIRSPMKHVRSTAKTKKRVISLDDFYASDDDQDQQLFPSTTKSEDVKPTSQAVSESDTSDSSSGSEDSDEYSSSGSDEGTTSSDESDEETSSGESKDESSHEEHV